MASKWGIANETTENWYLNSMTNQRRKNSERKKSKRRKNNLNTFRPPSTPDPHHNIKVRLHRRPITISQPRHLRNETSIQATVLKSGTLHQWQPPLRLVPTTAIYRRSGRESYLELLKRRRSTNKGRSDRLVASTRRDRNNIVDLRHDPRTGIHIDPTPDPPKSVTALAHSHDKRCTTYRSTHSPGNLAPTLLAAKPNLSKTGIYQGLRPAERSKTRPASFNARLSAWIWISASSPAGSNQSIESMTMAMVRLWGATRAMTSLISSVWIRRFSKAPGRLRRAWALAER